MDKLELLESFKLCVEGADKIRATIKTPGWKLINGWLEEIKNYNNMVLKTENIIKNQYKTIHAQAVVNVIENLICSIDVTIQKGDEADKEIKKAKKKK